MIKISSTRTIIITMFIFFAHMTPIKAYANADDDFQKGVAAFNSGDYKTALRLLEPLEKSNYQYANTFTRIIRASNVAKQNLKAAEKGNAEAQLKIGLAYINGEGVQRDGEKGEMWVRKAAAQGLQEANLSLTGEYFFERGLAAFKEEDYATALKYFMPFRERKTASYMQVESFISIIDKAAETKRYIKDAENGNVKAMVWLAGEYLSPTGWRPDREESVKWFRKAAERGDTFAQFRLADIYAEGEDTPEDTEEAKRWFLLVAAADRSLGDVLSKRLNELDKIRKERVKFLLTAAESKNEYIELPRTSQILSQNYSMSNTTMYPRLEAQVELGERYRRGQGMPQDDKAAVKWLSLAAEKGDTYSQVVLGSMYRTGKGMARNETEAIKWFQKPKGRAIYDLGVIFMAGNHVAMNKLVAYALFQLFLTQRSSDNLYNSRAEVQLALLAKKLSPTEIQQAESLATEMAKQEKSLGVLGGYLAK